MRCRRWCPQATSTGMGGATARYLAQAGLLVVGIADADGIVVSAEGLDVERLLLSRDEFGRVDRGALRQADRVLPVDQWLSVDTDVLVDVRCEERNERLLAAPDVHESP